MTDDDAVAEVVGATLVLAAIVLFLVVVSATWVPVWVEDTEAAHAATLRTSLSTWADAVDEHAARDLEGRTFSRTLAVGRDGVPVLGFGAASGGVAVETGPTLSVYDPSDATAEVFASGALAVTTDPTRFPSQTLRYAFGAVEVGQAEGAWLDLRDVLRAERGRDGLAVVLQVAGVAGGPRAVGTNGDVVVDASLTSVDRVEGEDDAWLRVVVTGVEADAWRNAVRRVLGESLLLEDGDGLACATSTDDYCFDASTNTASTMDLYLLDADAWSATETTLDVEVRS